MIEIQRPAPHHTKHKLGANMDKSKIYSTWWSGNCYHLEQLNAIINSVDVRAYAHILHDKCKKENSDELKKPHYRCSCGFYEADKK
jgi:hypothetical protein